MTQTDDIPKGWTPVREIPCSHEKPIARIAWTVDGNYLISSSFDGTLKIWKAENGQEVRTLRGHGGGVYGIAVLPDGKHILSGSDDKTLKLWDIGSGQIVRTLSGHKNTVNEVIVTPDGQKAISGSQDNTLKIWDIGSGQEIHTLNGHTNLVSGLAFTPDKKYVISGSEDWSVRIWDIGSGEGMVFVEGLGDEIYGVTVTADGRRVLAASGSNKYVYVWNRKTTRLEHALTGHTTGVLGLCLSPGGRYSVSKAGDTVLLWDCRTWEVLSKWPEKSAYIVSSVAFHPQRHTLMASYHTSLRDKPIIYIWKLSY